MTDGLADALCVTEGVALMVLTPVMIVRVMVALVLPDGEPTEVGDREGPSVEEKAEDPVPQADDEFLEVGDRKGLFVEEKVEEPVPQLEALGVAWGDRLPVRVMVALVQPDDETDEVGDRYGLCVEEKVGAPVPEAHWEGSSVALSVGEYDGCAVISVRVAHCDAVAL